MTSDLQCTHEELFHGGHTSSFLCGTVAAKVCSGDFINFYEMYWCNLDAQLWSLMIIAIIFILFIFKYTSVAVDEYVCEGVTIISDRLGLSQSLSAVTLLALANGAGDVITAIISGSAPGGVSYNIGALYGAGLFVAAMVVAMCILGNKEQNFIQFDKWIIYRDVAFYILSTVVTIIFALVGYINILEAVILLVIYIALVLFVIIKEKMDKKKAEKEAAEAGVKKGYSGLGGLFSGNKLAIGEDTVDEKKDETNTEEKRKDEKEEVEQKDVEQDEDTEKLVKIDEKVENNKDLLKSVLGANADSAALMKAFAVVAMGSFLKEKIALQQAAKARKWSDRSFMEKMSCIIDFPMKAICYLTACPVSHHEYDYKRAMIFPIPGIAFMIWIFTKISYPWVYLELGLPLVVIYYVLALWFLPKKVDAEQEAPKWYMAFTIQGVLAGLMYTYVLVGVLIDNLNTIGIVLNLSTTYLGLTILAVGNALPDALTTIKLAKNPKTATMAISGGYAGQLFGLLIGFGLSMLKLTLQTGNQTFNLFAPAEVKSNLLDIMVIGTALLVLVFTFCWGKFNGMKMTKTFAWIILGMYLIFFGAATIIAIIQASNTY